MNAEQRADTSALEAMIAEKDAEIDGIKGGMAYRNSLLCRIETERDEMRQQLAACREAIQVLSHTANEKQLQLTAANEEIERLKYAAENPNFNGRFDTWQAVAGKYRHEASDLAKQLAEKDVQIKQLLEYPYANEALEAMVGKAGEVMRERCAIECEQRQMAYATAGYERHAQATAGLSDAIRALPAVALEDLK